MQIAVFCSSSNDLASVYYKEAEELGSFIGKENHTLIYGGSNRGLMETLAKGVKAEGGFVIGILPSNMRSQASEIADEMLFVETLSDRKELMNEYADIFVVLSGGFGTLDELFNVLANAQIGAHDKKLVLVNSNQFYTPLLVMFDKIVEEKFGSESNKSSFVVVNNVNECAKYLRDNDV
jgi:uncharacterized protein (TIGR00730 family)